jgi:hypothetical protein
LRHLYTKKKLLFYQDGLRTNWFVSSKLQLAAKLKTSGALSYSGDPKFMDYYELTFFSSLLSHINAQVRRKTSFSFSFFAQF